MTHTSRLTLAAVPSAASDARAFAAMVLHHWQLDALHDAATLIVSELVTNALRAITEAGASTFLDDPFGAPYLSVQLAVQPDGLRLSVHDSSSRLPHLQALDYDAEHGRGLVLVRAMSSRWDAYRLSSGGKVVWAELTTSTPGTGIPLNGPEVGLTG